MFLGVGLYLSRPAQSLVSWSNQRLISDVFKLGDYYSYTT